MRALAWLILALPLAAENPLVERGHSHFYNLEYDEALADFEQAAREHPELPDLHNHIAKALVFREMFRDGALESELVSGNNSFLRLPSSIPYARGARSAFLPRFAGPWISPSPG